MKAYVINQDQLKQYIVIAFGAVVLSFILGFVVGNMGDKSGERALVEPVVESVDTGDESSAVLSETETGSKDKSVTPQSSATKKVDEKADEKKTSADDKKTTQNKSVEKPALVTIAKTQPARVETPKEIKPAVVKPVVIKPEPIKSAVETTPKPVLSNSDITEANPVEDIPVDVSTMPNEMLLPRSESLGEKRMYSIQAGMFASKTNALSFIEKLAVEKFDAYVTDFVSTSGAVKYNVRVGHFDERDKAREKLQDFQKYFSTPAYVVISQ